MRCDVDNVCLIHTCTCTGIVFCSFVQQKAMKGTKVDIDLGLSAYANARR